MKMMPSSRNIAQTLLLQLLVCCYAEDTCPPQLGTDGNPRAGTHACSRPPTSGLPDVCKSAGRVLGYVTPWNGRGYDVARAARGKLTHVAPVWYQVRGAADSLELHGGHDLDADWLQALRAPTDEGCAAPRIVPRVVLELPPQELMRVLGNPASLARLLRGLCDERSFDGLVMEGLAQWTAGGLLAQPQARAALLGLFAALGAALHGGERRLELVAVIPPAASAAPGARGRSAHAALFTSADLQALLPHVDLFSLNAYDASSGQGVAGANAPLPWLEANLEALLSGAEARRAAGRLLLGLNFYGTDFDLATGDVAHLTGAAFSELRDARGRRPKRAWDAADAEHVSEYQGDGGAEHILYYPSLRSIQARLDLAGEYGVGVAVWELGQGMDEFMDLF